MPEATFNTRELTIRGSDGEWYEVPEPVLIRYMVMLDMSSAAVRKTSPRLIRPAEANEGDRVTRATEGNFALLATDELLAQVTGYLESGNIERLLDIQDLCQTLAAIQGVERMELARARRRRTHELGTYNARLVLHPDASTG